MIEEDLTISKSSKDPHYYLASNHLHRGKLFIIYNSLFRHFLERDLLGP